jgi:hypothetical protein
MFRKPEQPVYYWNNYWQIWVEVIGYDNETGIIVLKDLEPINKGAISPQENYLKEYNLEYGQLKKNSLSLRIVNREDFRKYKGTDAEDFKKAITETSGEAFRLLRKIHVPLPRFKFE